MKVIWKHQSCGLRLIDGGGFHYVASVSHFNLNVLVIMYKSSKCQEQEQDEESHSSFVFFSSTTDSTNFFKLVLRTV